MRVGLLVVLLAASAQAAEIAGETSRTMAFEVKLGPYKPLIDRQSSLTSRPYEENFGGGPMLLGEIELDRQFWQGFGSIGVGVSIGYAEKFGKAVDAATQLPADESTGIRLVPIKALAVYRWDWAAIKHNIPLVPYLKGGLVMAPWWVLKGKEIEEADGLRGAGVKWGAAFVLGLSLQLDFLDPRLARDFDTSAGVNHTYLFAEWAVQEINNFGAGGLDLSSRHWMFGLTFEF